MTREELFEVMEKIAGEREAARPIVAQLIASGAPIEDVEIPEGWRTAGMVMELTAASDVIQEAEPSRSRAFAQLALAVTTGIASAAYPGVVQDRLRGCAWAEIGHTHRFQSAYGAALRAFSTAEESFQCDPALSHDYGCAKFARCNALIFGRRNQDAPELLQESLAIFREHGDENRIGRAELTRGLLHFHRGELHAAASIWEVLVDTMHGSNDRHTLAMLYNNLGGLYAELGRKQEAVPLLQRALSLFAELGLSGLVAKAEWGLARALLSSGDFVNAGKLLRRLRDDFLKRELPEDAGLVGLDLAETMIATGNVEEAKRLIQTALGEFCEASLSHEAMTALGYLRDVLPTNRDIHEGIKNARSSLNRPQSEAFPSETVIENRDLRTRKELFDVMEQIAAEREAACPIVADLIASGAPIDDIEIPEEWRTAGMVMELCGLAFSQLESQPRASLSFAQLALAIATDLSPQEYQPPALTYLKGRAWKEIGYAHRYSQAFKAAIRAYQTAESIFATDDALIEEKAAAAYLRAGILFFEGKYDEAVAINAASAEVFCELGNRERQIRCDVLTAAIEYRKGHLEEARTRYEVALKELETCDDPHTSGIVQQGLSHVYRLLGRTRDALAAMRRSREIFTALNMPADVNRADWSHALVLLESSQFAEALSLLRPLRHDYLARNMPEDAGEVGLCIVDALIATSQLDEAKVLTEQILSEFVDANLNRGAITALAYLRDLLLTSGDVRSAIRKLRTNFRQVLQNCDFEERPGANLHTRRKETADDPALPEHNQSTPADSSDAERRVIFQLIEQITSERETARPIVANVCARNAPIKDAGMLLEIPNEIPEAWRTAGMVIELLDLSYSTNESEPRKSLSLSLLALAISTNISEKYPNPLPTYLCGRAWREIGYAQRYLGALDASVRAYQKAEMIFSSESALVHDRAAAQFARAACLTVDDRYDEATSLLPSAAAVFQSVGDRARELRCQILDAVASGMRGDMIGARRKYEAVLGPLHQLDDLHTLGGVFQNLGWVYHNLRDPAESVSAYGKARDIFRDLGMPAETNRADWGLARVLLDGGEAAKALPLLARLRKDYLARKMVSAAGEVGLDMVNAFVATNQLHAAKTTCEQVLSEFMAARLNTRAITALAYLRDILQNAHSPAHVARRVRSCVKKLHSERQQVFLSLEENDQPI